MNNQEKAREILFELERYDTFSVLNCINKMAEWKEQQFKEYLEKNLSDIVFECIEEYKKIKGSINDNGTLRSDYQLAQNIAITLETKIINELFKED